MKTRNAARRAGGRRVPSRRAPGEGRNAGFRISKLSVAVALIFAAPGWAAANPTGGRVVAGSAAIGSPGASTVEITQGSHRAIIEWNGFSIAAGETTRFIQPSPTAVTLNRVIGGDPSRILGNLQANGIVYLVNGNGILFGQGAKIDVAGLVASTADIRNDDFMAERMAFTRPGHASAAVVNQGDITVAEGGLVALVAPGVENAGRIQAKLGRVLLASGDRFAIDFNGDGLISFAVEAAGADGRGRPVDADGRALVAGVANRGEVIADGGMVLLTAAEAGGVLDQAINMDGIIRARSLTGRSGSVTLDAGAGGSVRVAGTVDVTGEDGARGGTVSVTADIVELAGGARIDASGDAGGGTILVGGDYRGQGDLLRAQSTRVGDGVLLRSDATGAGDGGTVVIWSDGDTAFGGTVSARGGALSGDGGLVEVSGKRSLGFAGRVDTGAAFGRTGVLLLDPVHAVIGAGSDGTSGDTQTINAASLVAVLATSNVVVSADESISVTAAVDASAQSNANTLHFEDADGGGLTVNFAAPIVLGVNQRLTGEASGISVADGGRIQNAVDVAAAGTAPGTGAHISVQAGSYDGGVVVDKAGVTIAGTEGARMNVAAGQTGITVAAGNVTVEGMTIAGPETAAYTLVDWDSRPTTFGISVNPGVAGAAIRGNTIRDIRTGVSFLQGSSGSVTGNTIDNTKGSVLIRSDDVTVSGNRAGATGSEWDVVILNHVGGAAYFGDPLADQKSYGEAVMALSAANDGMTVLDRRYGVNGFVLDSPHIGNRSHVLVDVDAVPSFDFNLGNGIGNLRQPLSSIQGGVDAVVHGGYVTVRSGEYAGNVVIGKSLTLSGAGAGQTVLRSAVAGGGDAITINGASGVVLRDLTVAEYAHGLRVNGIAHDLTLRGMAFEDNTYAIRNGNTTRADRFRMIDSTITGGLIGVQTYNGYTLAGGVPVATASFSDALFENVTVSGASYKGFYLETANDLVMRNVTIRDTGNAGGPPGSQFRQYGHAVDINLKYDAFGSVTFENLVVENSGFSAGDPTRAAVVIKTRGVPGDSATYTAAPASLQSVEFSGGRIAGSGGVGIRIETLADGSGGQPSVRIGGGIELADNGQDILTGRTNVDASGAVFAGALDGFAIEDRVTHALDDAARGLVVWNPGNLYVTQGSGSIQRAVDAAAADVAVHVSAGTYGENLQVGKSLRLSGDGVAVHGFEAAHGHTLGLSGRWSVGGSADFAGTVVLHGDLSLDTSAADGAITFRGALLGSGSGGQGLALDAGSGTVTVHDIGTAAVALGDVTVRAGEYAGAAGTSYVRSFAAHAGDVAVGSSTLNASGLVDITAVNLSGSITASNVNVVASGNVSGSIAAANTASISGGNVSGVIRGANVEVAALHTANTTVIATNHAAISGTNVQGSVQAPSATIHAAQGVAVHADVGSLVLTAQSGTVSGNMGSVVIGAGAGVIAVNGEAAVAADPGVARTRSVLQPDTPGAPAYGEAPLVSPARLAFGQTAGSVFDREFPLGAAEADGDVLAGFLGGFWEDIAGSRENPDGR